MSTLAVVINVGFGGFGISEEGQSRYEEKSGKLFDHSLSRHDPHLINTIRELGSRAASSCCSLMIHYIPLEMEKHYKISNYDGGESIILLYSQKAITEAREIATSSDSSLTAEQKLVKISEVLSEPCVDTYFRMPLDPSWRPNFTASESDPRKENFYSERFDSDEDDEGADEGADKN
jgi:hypothetical protein